LSQAAKTSVHKDFPSPLKSCSLCFARLRHRGATAAIPAARTHPHSALLQQLKQQLCVNTRLHSIHKTLEDQYLHQTLILFDMMEADRRTIEVWQSAINRYHESVKLLLLNTPDNYHFREIETWPRISAVFYLSTDEEHLVEGIRSVIRGECYFSQGFASYLINQSGAFRHMNTEDTGLTHREKEILNKLRVGASNTEIAQLLFIITNDGGGETLPATNSI